MYGVNVGNYARPMEHLGIAKFWALFVSWSSGPESNFWEFPVGICTPVILNPRSKAWTKQKERFFVTTSQKRLGLDMRNISGKSLLVKYWANRMFFLNPCNESGAIFREVDRSWWHYFSCVSLGHAKTLQQWVHHVFIFRKGTLIS